MPAGRPPTLRAPHRVTFQAEHEQLRVLDGLGGDRSEHLRRALDEYLNRHSEALLDQKRRELADGQSLLDEAMRLRMRAANERAHQLQGEAEKLCRRLESAHRVIDQKLGDQPTYQEFLRDIEQDLRKAGLYFVPGSAQARFYVKNPDALAKELRQVVTR